MRSHVSRNPPYARSVTFYQANHRNDNEIASQKYEQAEDMIGLIESGGQNCCYGCASYVHNLINLVFSVAKFLRQQVIQLRFPLGLIHHVLRRAAIQNER